ncbi:hypothetical protein OAK17_07395, partial [Alphaproteobacteria bacterium]|nr:hypothetical protein [Alphaproteobacteria bacterium]
MNKDKTNKYNNSIKEKFTKKVFTINSDQPFIDTLAKGINVRYENQLEKANVRILLPNRRSVRALKDSLISLSKNKACIIPKIIALGDLDYNDFESIDHSNNLEELFYNQALPPINELERQFLLTKLVSKWNELDSYHSISLKEQTKLALDLGRLIDQFQYYGISIDRLKKIIPKDLSEHWQTNLKFLNIILVSWPKILNELKKDDIVESRNKLIKSIIKEWEIFPPEYPIIAAGSTGSNKATSDLLMRISMLPRGEVIIPGLDKNLESYSWKNLDENHPQYFIRELLRKFDIDRESINSWNENNKKNKNNKSIFISEVMRPYISTNQWKKFNLNFNDSNFLTRFECVNQREEAGIISLIIRETIENKNVKIALVTQDRDLGRRVMSEIKRWNIEIDNSSGNSLLSTIEGSLIQLTADLMINNFNSLSLLSALKHPISSCGYDLISYRELINYFDKYIVRELYADKKANIIKLYLKLYSRKKNLNTREGDLFNLFEKINKVVLDFEKLSSQPQVDFSI